mmetsp:Transcript_91301/g.279482  ORF Transcript_91301/g.279482 Transcript_91301/m.279482 type:complete len:214 (+) Transcript_91301:161-802(+)
MLIVLRWGRTRRPRRLFCRRLTGRSRKRRRASLMMIRKARRTMMWVRITLACPVGISVALKLVRVRIASVSATEQRCAMIARGGWADQALQLWTWTAGGSHAMHDSSTCTRTTWTSCPSAMASRRSKIGARARPPGRVLPPTGRFGWTPRKRPLRTPTACATSSRFSGRRGTCCLMRGRRPHPSHPSFAKPLMERFWDHWDGNAAWGRLEKGN